MDPWTMKGSKMLEWKCSSAFFFSNSLYKKKNLNTIDKWMMLHKKLNSYNEKLQGHECGIETYQAIKNYLKAN